MAKKQTFNYKTYEFLHGANQAKENLLWDLYEVYTTEYQHHTKLFWKDFLANKLSKFSHLGSTKHFKTQLNASYLQIVRSQACATLNKHIASIELKFNSFINCSTIKDKTVLHQLRTINSSHTWLNPQNYYYPEFKSQWVDDFGHGIDNNLSALHMDDYGNEFKPKIKPYNFKVKTLISKNIIKLSRKIFHHITEKQRVKFPYLGKPKLVLDDRVVQFEPNVKSKSFDGWLNISSLEPYKKVLIPVKTYDHFNHANGIMGKTIELNFVQLPYKIENKQYKLPFNHDSLDNLKSHRASLIKISKPKKINQTVEQYTNSLDNYDKRKKQAQGIKDIYTTDRFIRILVNKKSLVEDDIFSNELKTNIKPTNIVKNREIAFDLGLCVLLATSDGETYGNYWLDKLTEYDKKITDLMAARQACGLKVRSVRYDQLIAQVKGFIKSEINKILNQYFATHLDIKTVIVESLIFNNPNLGKRLNRIIQNFGLGVFNNKLDLLSKTYGFTIERLNPAYLSQQCRNCDYVDNKNRQHRSLFHCVCCGLTEQADIQSARVLLKRFRDKAFINCTDKFVHRTILLGYLKRIFATRIMTLITHGKTTRRKLLDLKPSYFESILTSEVLGLEPVTGVG